MSKSETSNLLSMYHIDRGINLSLEMKLMFTNLKHRPEEFNSDIASRMERLCQILRNCFYDCYQNSEFKHMSYDEICTSLERLEKELNKEVA